MAGPGSLSAWNVAPGGDVDLKKKMAFALMQQGIDASPVGHWTQALARTVQGGMGGFLMNAANEEDEADAAKTRQIMSALSGGTQTIPQPPVQQAPIDPTAPRGIRNNNPGNIVDGPFAQRMPGYAGNDGRFAKFASMDNGNTATDSLLASYGAKGINTVGGVINRWAPPSDNNPTNAYAAKVAQALGVAPDAQIDLSDPAIRSKIAAAIGNFENGRPVPTAPTGAPVDQPRGGMPDDRRMQMIQALSQTRRGAPFAQQLFAKEIEREATRARPLTEQEKGIYPGAVAIKAGGEPIFPPPSTNVQLSTVANPVLEGVGKQIVGQREAAQSASREVIPYIHEARKALDEGAITGQFAEPRLFISKVGSLLGLGGKEAENTEVVRATLGNQVLAYAKTLGANPSNADRDYIEKVKGGQIALEEGSMRRLLDMQEKWARQAIRNFNADSKKLQGASPDGTYKQIAPLMSIDEPGEYTAPPKKAAPSVDDLLKKYGK